MFATVRKPRQLSGPLSTWFSCCPTEIGWSSVLSVPSVVPHAGTLIGHAGGGTCAQQLNGWSSSARTDTQQTDFSSMFDTLKNMSVQVGGDSLVDTIFEGLLEETRLQNNE